MVNMDGGEKRRNSIDFAVTIGIATLCRLVLNTARRFAYPFAPALARGLGVSLPAVTSLIAVNQVTGLFGLVSGPLGDQRGYRVMLLAGMGFLTAGMLAGGAVPRYAVVVIALFLAGVGKSVFDPAIQAYAGRHVPYAKRGFAVGIMETAWAGSTLVGVPLMGFLMGVFHWRAPFYALAAAGLAGFLCLAWVFPEEKSQNLIQKQAARTIEWRSLVTTRASLAIMAFAFFVSAANDIFFVVYGAWFEKIFHLRVVELGMTAIVIGAAELGGELLTAIISDRCGLHRSIMCGLVLSGIGYALYPTMAQTLPWALIGLFILFMTVEFAIVTAISLSTEILPASRGTMMAGYLAAAGIGRVTGAVAGGILWYYGSMTAVCVASVVLSICAALSVAAGLAGWQPSR